MTSEETQSTRSRSIGENASGLFFFSFFSVDRIANDVTSRPACVRACRGTAGSQYGAGFFRPPPFPRSLPLFPSLARSVAFAHAFLPFSISRSFTDTSRHSRHSPSFMLARPTMSVVPPTSSLSLSRPPHSTPSARDFTTPRTCQPREAARARLHDARTSVNRAKRIRAIRVAFYAEPRRRLITD